MLVLVLVAGLVTAVVTVRRSFPQTDGEIEVPGLGAKVEVLRDEHGIPQVYADTSDDLFYAQGYVQAQDRFFEMDFRRHVTSGRLSELLGEDALETDMYIRTMGWRRVAEQELSLLSPETQAYLEAFSAGVNAYIDSHTPSEMSLEYSVLALNGLDYTPEEWTPRTPVAWLKAMAWDLRGNMEDEIERALMSVNHTAEEIAELYPPYPYDRHRRSSTRARSSTASSSRTPAAAAPASRPGRALTPRSPTPSSGSTPGWSAMPEMLGHGRGHRQQRLGRRRRALHDRQPILANDPHLGISMPGIWYQMGLHCTEVSEACPFDVTGFTFAGVPGRGDRPQPADRLGLHQPRPRRGRPLPREGRRQALRVRRQASGRSRPARRSSRSSARTSRSRSRCAPPGTARCSPTSRRS